MGGVLFKARYLMPCFCFLIAFLQMNAGHALLRSQDDASKQANAVLALMSYSAIPDLASSSLSISNANTGNPQIAMSQIGGGATMSTDFPIYLEGAVAYSRYDPVFIASNGTDERKIPVKWTSGTLQAGIGYDFMIAEHWAIRPIFNMAAGVVTSDMKIASALVGAYLGREIEFLDGGSMTVGGLGGSLMLDYEFHAPDAHDIDFEARYSYIHLQTMGGSTSVKGYSDSSTGSLYYRYRAPIDEWKVLQKPFRYVLEGSLSHYMGDQAGVLGFDYLTSVGLGVELDSSAYKVWVTRTRLVARYMFGVDVTGYSFGLACSF
ncbi:hypothetical protein [Bdellovibrio sp. NC01]|uniref:hypothetical protein n=1 Tax=Bdellovibrio sp. NC01 TaxID=2220073 RepID=UPI001AF0106D|nr:hypothetical protein [Bdellovibrio sp. NC01]